MNNQNEHLDNLSEIRSLMERSSRFISLSGLTGVIAGVFALLGIVAAYIYLPEHLLTRSYYLLAFQPDGSINYSFFVFFLMDAFFVLMFSLTVGWLFTARNAKQKGLPSWDPTAKRLVINLFIPLITGGLFCLVLVYHGLSGFIAPATLIFYGLGLINASKYTLNDIRYLGFLEIITGLVASIFIGYGLLFWAFGFGVLHIVYGLVMFNKYEK